MAGKPRMGMEISAIVCRELEEQKDKLERHSIYILQDDKDTDYDFYVLVDSKEARKNNEFLKELMNFIGNDDNSRYKSFENDKNRNKLKDRLGSNITDDDLTVLNFLKIAIERYPFRLFIVSDNAEKAEKSCKEKSPFLYKRICWLDKKLIIEIFKEDNKKILQAYQNYKNLLKKLDWRDRVILWLYHRWIRHLMRINDVEAINVFLSLGEEKDSAFYCITFPQKKFKSKESPTRRGKLADINFSETSRENHYIVLDRHLNSHPVIKNNTDKIDKCLYAESISGSQFQYPLIQRAAIDTFEGLSIYFLIIENAFNKLLIVDERVLNWFYSVPAIKKFALFFQGIFPVEEFKDYKIKENTELYLRLKNGKFEINKKLLIDIIGLLSEKDINRSWKNNNQSSLLDSVISIWQKNFLTLIIHQGILDKIEHVTHKSILELKDIYPFIVITSGRGRPDKIPAGEKFIPFADLDYLMQSYPEKLLFTKLMLRVTETG